jgi:hypothetical protein
MNEPPEDRLSTEFDTRMHGIYRRAKDEVSYDAPQLLQMLDAHGGLETAKVLLHRDELSDGYIALWERGRLDLTVEALVLEPRWESLFTEEELNTARRRLRQYGLLD